MRLLVVDDHPEFRAVTVRLLGLLGHEVRETAEPDEAAEILASDDGIDVVMLDLFLAGTDGLELGRRLEATRPGVRVLFMSGDDVAPGQLDSVEGARRQFIEKPFSLPTLEAALETLARRD